MNRLNMYIRSLLLVLLTTASIQVVAQDVSFVPPLDIPITFAGNFGEIRANHFHGGLDFKTRGRIGEKVYAMAKGYISRIRVTHGSGYVLDVVYENGYTTINRHLSSFVGEIARRVEELQYAKESWEVEIVPEPGEYPVKPGQVIALSGNTGYSFGPHLHLDMIETSTGEQIDPLPFFKCYVNDHTAPKAKSFMLFPQPGLGTVDGEQECKGYPINFSGKITAWGLIGVGICAYDYMEGANNRYGVHTVVLEVDGKEVFRSKVDRFSNEENRYINSWAYGQFMKSFIEPGNRLRMLKALNGTCGLIDINEERPYQFVYTLSDALGNTSRLAFTVHGKSQKISAVCYDGKYSLKWDRVNKISEPGLRLVIPKERLYKDVQLNYAVRADSGDVAFTYQLHDRRIPLHKYCDMYIGLRHHPIKDSLKYYVAGINPKGKKYYVGGKYVDGCMKVSIRELATFTVAVDTISPVITPLFIKKWGNMGRILFKVKDSESGIAYYRGTIDGKYALFGKPNSISGNLVCELDSRYVKKGGKHKVELTVRDRCGNEKVECFNFTW